MKRLILMALLCASPALAATRFSLPGGTGSPVNPTADGGWEDASEIERRTLTFPKGSSAFANGQTVDILEDQANYQDLDTQFVSAEMAAGVIFTSGSTTVTSVIMMRELASTDDVTQCILGIRVVNSAGNSVQATLLAVSNVGITAEMLNTGYRNKQCANADAVTASYTTVLGDRLVVEVGYQTDGAETSPQASARWGENAADCAENETNTTDCAGWVEFSNTITFSQVAKTVRPAFFGVTIGGIH